MPVNPQTNDNPNAQSETVTAAQIVIGKIGTGGGGGTSQFIPSPDKKSILADYEIFNTYEKDQHKYMMGITSPNGFQGNSVAFVQLAAPTLLWISRWTACQAGSEPPIPDTDVGDSSWILLDEIIEPVMMNCMPDGTNPIYRINGTYVYGNTNPNARTTANTVFPRPPNVKDVFTRTISASLLTQNLINQRTLTKKVGN